MPTSKPTPRHYQLACRRCQRTWDATYQMVTYHHPKDGRELLLLHGVAPTPPLGGSDLPPLRWVAGHHPPRPGDPSTPPSTISHHRCRPAVASPGGLARAPTPDPPPSCARAARPSDRPDAGRGSGRLLALRQRTHGEITLLYFGYTHCPDVCPLTMSMLAQALHALPPSIAHKVAVVFVTTDPARDIPTRLAQWLAIFDRSFVGLTGSRQATAQAQRQAGLPPAVTEPLGHSGYGVDHGAFIYASTPDDLAHLVYFQGVQPAALAADLRRLATHGWSANPRPPACDPALDRAEMRPPRYDRSAACSFA